MTSALCRECTYVVKPVEPPPALPALFQSTSCLPNWPAWPCQAAPASFDGIARPGMCSSIHSYRCFHTGAPGLCAPVAQSDSYGESARLSLQITTREGPIERAIESAIESERAISREPPPPLLSKSSTCPSRCLSCCCFFFRLPSLARPPALATPSKRFPAYVCRSRAQTCARKARTSSV